MNYNTMAMETSSHVTCHSQKLSFTFGYFFTALHHTETTMLKVANYEG